MKRILFLISIIPILFTSCMSTVQVGEIVKPAQKEIHKEINKLTLVNRTYLSDLNIQYRRYQCMGYCDRPGALDCIKGMRHELSKRRYFNIVGETIKMKSDQESGTLPAVLTPYEIQQICTQNYSNGLLVLEYLKLDTAINEVVKKEPLNSNSPITTMVEIHHAIKTANLKLGWRIYGLDPVHPVEDEYSMVRTFFCDSSSYNFSEALKKLPPVSQLVASIANEMGVAYITRVSPYRMNVVRNYYGKGNSDLKLAKSYVKQGDWEGARKIWEPNSVSGKDKTRGMACLNLAVYYEYKQNIPKAMDYAGKAVSLYPNSSTRNYLNELNSSYPQKR